MIKRVVSMLLVFSVLLAVPAVANAAVAEDIPDTTVTPSNLPGDSGIMPCTLIPPTVSFNLTNQRYPVTLTALGEDRLYTNRCFYPNKDNKLFVTITVSKSSASLFGTATVSIGFYDVTTGKDFGAPYVMSNVGTTAKTVTIYAFEMNPQHLYAVYFLSEGAMVTGTGEVYY